MHQLLFGSLLTVAYLLCFAAAASSHSSYNPAQKLDTELTAPSSSAHAWEHVLLPQNLPRFTLNAKKFCQEGSLSHALHKSASDRSYMVKIRDSKASIMIELEEFAFLNKQTTSVVREAIFNHAIETGMRGRIEKVVGPLNNLEKIELGFKAEKSSIHLFLLRGILYFVFRDWVLRKQTISSYDESDSDELFDLAIEDEDLKLNVVRCLLELFMTSNLVYGILMRGVPEPVSKDAHGVIQFLKQLGYIR